MKRAIFRARARRDVHANADYIGQRHPGAGRRFYDAYQQSVKRLLDFPEIGTLCEFDSPHLAGLRVWPVKGFKNYLIFYLSSQQGIIIVRVLHGARDIESLFKEDE